MTMFTGIEEEDREVDPVVYRNSNDAQFNDFEERTHGALPEWRGAWSLTLRDAQNQAGWIILPYGWAGKKDAPAIELA